MPGATPFVVQPPEAGLNPKGQQSLTSLLQTQAAEKRLQAHLEAASKRLTESATVLNDRASQENTEFLRLNQSRSRVGEHIDDDDSNSHHDFQQKVKNLTHKMDYAIRNNIDNSVRQAALLDALKEGFQKSATVSQAAQARGRGVEAIGRARRGPVEAEEDSESEAADEGTENNEPPPQPNPSDAPSAIFRDCLNKNEARWASQTLTERYAKDNDYRGFYSAIFYAQNAGEDAPPVPHEDFWFAEEEGRELPRPQARGNDGELVDGDSELVVAAEHGRIKCPITLMTFRDPWKSKKCLHSFEKDAIFALIRESRTYLEWTPEQRAELNEIRDRRRRERKEKEIGTPQACCPECSAMLTTADLEPNALLLRKVKRRLEQQKREQEEADEQNSVEEDEVPRGTHSRPVGLGSSPPNRAKIEQVKKERDGTFSASRGRISSTQTTSTGATVVELGDDDEEMTQG